MLTKYEIIVFRLWRSDWHKALIPKRRQLNKSEFYSLPGFLTQQRFLATVQEREFKWTLIPRCCGTRFVKFLGDVLYWADFQEESSFYCTHIFLLGEGDTFPLLCLKEMQGGMCDDQRICLSPSGLDRLGSRGQSLFMP